ncbi:MAG TPA: DUF6580 family putative transport protein [Hanamia sp.]
MYQKKIIIADLLLMVLSLSLYRVLPLYTQGFMPMLSISIFAGAVIPNKKLAIALPLLSMLLSDFIFQFLFNKGMTNIAGFYQGQLVNYILFVLLVIFGFAMKKININSVFLFSISGSLMYFFVSNFVVWATHTGFSRPMTFNGLTLCYADAIAFYRDYGLVKGFAANFILGDLIWSSLIFSAYFFVTKKAFATKTVVQ